MNGGGGAASSPSSSRFLSVDGYICSVGFVYVSVWAIFLFIKNKIIKDQGF